MVRVFDLPWYLSSHGVHDRLDPFSVQLVLKENKKPYKFNWTTSAKALLQIISNLNGFTRPVTSIKGIFNLNNDDEMIA
jgi:hypothetical protein